MRIPDPYTISYRNDSNTLQFSLNRTCGLPEDICRIWQRRSFLRLPDELSQYRNPPKEKAAKASVAGLL